MEQMVEEEENHFKELFPFGILVFIQLFEHIL